MLLENNSMKYIKNLYKINLKKDIHVFTIIIFIEIIFSLLFTSMSGAGSVNNLNYNIKGYGVFGSFIFCMLALIIFSIFRITEEKQDYIYITNRFCSSIASLLVNLTVGLFIVITLTLMEYTIRVAILILNARENISLSNFYVDSKTLFIQFLFYFAVMLLIIGVTTLVANICALSKKATITFIIIAVILIATRIIPIAIIKYYFSYNSIGLLVFKAFVTSVVLTALGIVISFIREVER